MRSPSTIAGRLLRWFERNRRALPWRNEPRDPYRTWVSEVMLQQTRVEVVVPYFERFLLRFPTLVALADAPLDDVLAHWSGLGYYSRARNLHRAAQAARDGLPRTAAGLRALPGFGPYTSAAVASLAFGEDAPLVDGNVARVLSRLRRLPDPRQAWQVAAELLPKGRAGAFNEALMELGALVCTPKGPRCGECPLAVDCAGKDEPEAYPPPRKRPERPLLEWTALALTRKDGAILLARRPEGRLFAGLWDLPEKGPLPGIRIGASRALGIVEQTLTHREVRVHVEGAKGTGAPRHRDLRWLQPSLLGSVGLSSLARKCLAVAGVLQARG